MDSKRNPKIISIDKEKALENLISILDENHGARLGKKGTYLNITDYI